MYTTSISRFGRTDSIQQSPYLCELIFFILYVLQISSWQLIFSHSRVALSPFKTHMSFLILFLFNCTTCTHTTHIAALLHVPYTIHYQLFNPIPDPSSTSFFLLPSDISVVSFQIIVIVFTGTAIARFIHLYRILPTTGRISSCNRIVTMFVST